MDAVVKILDRAMTAQRGFILRRLVPPAQPVRMGILQTLLNPKRAPSVAKVNFMYPQQKHARDARKALFKILHILRPPNARLVQRDILLPL